MRTHLVTSQATYQDVAINLVLRPSAGPEAARTAASAVLRFKGLQAEEEAYLAQIVRRGGDPKAQSLAQEIAKLRGRLATLHHGSGQAEQVEQLRHDLDARELALGRLSRNYQRHMQVRNFNLRDLQQALADRTGLLEIRLYQPITFGPHHLRRAPLGRAAAGRVSVSPGLDRVRTAARLNGKERFTALLHHVDVGLLRSAYSWLKRDAGAGVDGVTWQEYSEDLERKLVDLHARIHRGAYRAQPSRRHYIPKPDGRQRPLGIAALEDKIVQRAVIEVLNAIYEEDFLGFWYGFRPGRGPHDALDALAVGIGNTRVNWVLDADIAGFLDPAA